MIIQSYTTSFLKQLLEGVHDFRSSDGDVFKLALYTEDANLNINTTEYSTTGEVVATGYTSGGITLTNVNPSIYNSCAISDFDDVSWTAEITARGALIYNTTPAHTYSNPSVVVLDFGINRVSTNGVFRVQFPLATDATAIIALGAV